VQLALGVESIKGFGQLWLSELLGNKGRLGGVAEIPARRSVGKTEITIERGPAE